MKVRLILFCLLSVFAIIFFISKYSSTTNENSSPTRQVPDWMTTLVQAKETISPLDVYTFDCETIERKPQTLTTTCADFGIAIYGIKWKAWDATGALGIGSYSVNLCEPNCAEGKRVETPVSIQLKDLLFDGKKYYLNTAAISPLDPKQKILTAQEWDLGDFYRGMWAFENQ